MRDQGTYNMSVARTSPDFSYKKCIYWMLIALLTCFFIAICVIAAIGYKKPTKENYLGKHEPMLKGNTPTTIKVDNKLNEKEENQRIDKNLEQETVTNESKNAKQVGPRIWTSNNNEENQGNVKKFERMTTEAVKSEEITKIGRNFEFDTHKIVETTQTSELQDSKQTVSRNDLQSNKKEENQEIERNVDYETEYEILYKIVKSNEATKENQDTNDEIERNIVQEPLESTTKIELTDVVSIDHRRSQFVSTIKPKVIIQETTNEITETSTNDNSLLKTSMSSREEELISHNTENSISDATKLFKKATYFVTELFAASTTESSEYSGRSETSTKSNLVEIENTTDVPSPSAENHCQTNKVCSTNSCKKSASRMLALMDHSVDPCNDFYKFSCGGMKINHMEKEAEENFLGIDFDELPNDKYSYLSKFKTYYNSCVIFDSNYPANSVTLKRIYLNRLVEGLGKENSELNDLTDLIGNIIISHPYGSSSRLMPIFDVVMDIGPDGKYVPVLTVPLSVSDIFEAHTGDIYEQSCLKDSENFAKTEKSAKKIHDNYMSCLKNPKDYIINLGEAVTKLNIFDHLEDVATRSKKETEVIWNIEQLIENLGLITSQEKLKELRSAYNSPKYYNMKELNDKYKKINWNRLFKKIFAIDDVSKLSVKVMFPDYLDRIFKFMEETKFEDLKSILIAMSAHDMYVHYIKPNLICDREKYCKKLTIKVLGDIATNMYLKKLKKKDYLHKEQVAHKLFDKISNEYITALNNVSWLEKKDDFTKTINSIKLVTNIDLLEKEEARLQDKYSSTGELSLCFITNNDIFKHLKRKTMYAKLDINGDDPKNLWDFQIESLTKLPITIAPLKIIVLPFNVLDNSVARERESLQNYETYSKLGFMLSREIASFFNPTNIKNTDASDNSLYKDFVDLKLSDPKITQFENSLKINLDKEGIISTLDSRFSDDSALRLSYETYLKLVSSDQQFLWMNYSVSKLFYLSVAQQFCSSEIKPGMTGIDFYENEILSNSLRVNSIVMNSVHFSKTFDCSMGSSMNPEIKVDQFPFIEQSELEYNHD